MTMQNPPPKSRFHLELDIGASELPRLTRRLAEWAAQMHDLLDGRDDVPENWTRQRWYAGFWGGAGTHGHYEITDAGGPSEAEFDAQLEAWMGQERAMAEQAMSVENARYHAQESENRRRSMIVRPENRERKAGKAGKALKG